MAQHVYWDAPLWEVLLIVLMSLALLGWLLARTLRRPDISSAPFAVNTDLHEQPLFFFSRMRGLTCLNSAAVQTVNDLPASRRPLLLDTMTSTLLEACEEMRIIQEREWPKAGRSLVAIPIAGQTGDIAGSLALVTRVPSIPATGRARDERRTADAESWITLGSALRLHRTRPEVRVKHICPPVTEDAPIPWEECSLGYLEDTLFRHLLEHRAEVQRSETLFHVAWPDDEVECWGLRPEQRDRLRRLIYQLRQHVEPDPSNPRHVCTVRGVGYVLYKERDSDTR